MHLKIIIKLKQTTFVLNAIKKQIFKQKLLTQTVHNQNQTEVLCNGKVLKFT